MNYTIYTVPQITPATVYRSTLDGGQAIVENPEQIVLPVDTSIIYQPADFSRFADDFEKRKLLLVDPWGEATGAEIFAAFPQIREPKAAEIRAGGAYRLNSLASPYTPEERETWITQQREAELWKLNPAADVPMITAMATGRGIPVAALVEKITENVALFRTIAGQILGEQQRLLDLVYSATDYDEMRGVSW